MTSSPLVSFHQKDDTKKKKASLKRNRQEESDDLQEERRLTALLFGGVPQEENEETTQLDEDDVPIHEKPDSLLFQVDEVEDDEEEEEQGTSDDDDVNHVDSSAATKSAAWVDEDDDKGVNLMEGPSRLRKLRKRKNEVQPLQKQEYEQRLRNLHSKTTSQTAHTSWAKVPTSESKQQEQYSTTTSMLASHTTKLKPNQLSVLRCRDANQADPNQSVVQAVHFHPCSDPTQPLLLTAGLDKTMRFFKIRPDGQHEKIHGIHFPKLPIYSARFLGDSDKVVVSGRRPFYYIYDAQRGQLDCIPKLSGREERSLETMTTSADGQWVAFGGNDGYILLVHASSPQVVVSTMKLNGSVRAISLTHDSQYLYASGSDGQVYQYELKNRSCVNVFSNVDGTITSALATSPQHNQIAVGAESGVVNLYSSRKQQQQQPIKSLFNVQTSIDLLRYTHDGQVLAFGSKRDNQNSLKLLHVPSATVFSNWPTSKTPLGHVWSLDFSPSSHYMAIGNDKGKCLLYKLLHYSSQ